MDKQEPTIVERLEAEAAQAKAGLEQAQKDLAALTEDRDAKAREIDALKAAASEAEKKISGISAELETAKADTQAALELAAKAEARAKTAEGALARDPDALKGVRLAGTDPVNGTALAGDGQEPSTWAQALAMCGGDYVGARRKYPKAWESQFKK